MTQADKKLLLKDLCARLPYGVVCDIYNDTCTIKEKLLIGGLSHFCDDTIAVRPYLRPMSSMTKDEQKEFVEFHCVTLCPIIMDSCLTIENEGNMFDWLNAHHFDYRGLIEKGLAIEVTEENNPYKK